MIAKLENNGINIANATKTQLEQIQKLYNQAMAQSGLAASEVMLISLCRRFNIFYKVSCYAQNLINKDTKS